MKGCVEPPQALLADIDGVLLLDGRVLPGTVELARIFARRLALISNNSTHSQEDLCKVFAKAGVAVEPEQFFLAGVDTIRQMAHDLPGGRVLALCNTGMCALLRKNGLLSLPVQCWQEADAVLLCRDTEINYAKLEAAANAAQVGVPVYCANPDITHPGAKGIHLETGCLLALLKTAAPELNLRLMGKPKPALALAALDFVRAEARQALFIGDNLATDGACAQAVGIPFLHVGSAGGLSLEQALRSLRPCSNRPNLI
ncbi:MAG: HAD hydrolase-like protein [Deltaproteobacteria bacterium]|nr:HAD hydrolase-like protein [Deltaproteobacteria bacterium]